MNSLTPTTLFDMRPAQVLYEIKDLQKQWRDQNFRYTEAQKKLYADEYVQWERRDLFRMNQVIIDTSAVIRRSDDPYLLLEMTALKLLEMDRSVLIDQLLSEGISSSKGEVVASLKKENTVKNVNEKGIKKTHNLIEENSAEINNPSDGNEKKTQISPEKNDEISNKIQPKIS